MATVMVARDVGLRDNTADTAEQEVDVDVEVWVQFGKER